MTTRKASQTEYEIWLSMGMIDQILTSVKLWAQSWNCVIHMFLEIL